jgi:hypothetical protein
MGVQLTKTTKKEKERKKSKTPKESTAPVTDGRFTYFRNPTTSVMKIRLEMKSRREA